MSRRDELLKYIENDTLLIPMVEEIVYLENELDKLRTLPKIKINPKNHEQQKATPAARLYKEYLQQYLNAIKAIEKVTGKNETDEESILQKWVRSRVNKRTENMDS